MFFRNYKKELEEIKNNPRAWLKVFDLKEKQEPKEAWWNSEWNFIRRFLEWEKKRTERIWIDYYEPLITEEIDKALSIEGRFLLHKLVDNIEWREIDGLRQE